jgi:hypothetical protein
MVALECANVSWLSNASRVACLELYAKNPDLLKTVPAKQAFWRQRKILTLHDVVNIDGILGLLDQEVAEVEEAKKMLAKDPDNLALNANLRKETADVVVFAKTFQTFANGTWSSGRRRVLDGVQYAKTENVSVGGNLAEDVIGVVKGKNSNNYQKWHYDWGWMLIGREEVSDESVMAVYAVAKQETRKLRDEHGSDGVLPDWLSVAMMSVLQTRDERQLKIWLEDPLLCASVEAMLNIYEVAVSKFG